MYYHRKDDSGANWGMILICLGLIAVIWIISSIRSSSEYNNGICGSCGGNFVYQQAVGHRYSTDYIYICDKCGRMIQIDYYATPYNYDEPHNDTVKNLNVSHEDFVAE